MKKTMAKAMAAISLKMAQKACGSASMYGLHQTKEPSMKKLAK